MRCRSLLVSLALAGALACTETQAPVVAPPPPPPSREPDGWLSLQLKDLVIPPRSSPLYHFEYDEARRLTFASYHSGLLLLDVIYEGDRIIEMRNNTFDNHDRLRYSYDPAGRVEGVQIVDETGLVYTRLSFMYDGAALIGLEREQLAAGGFVVDRTMAFSYHADGNVMQIIDHRAAIPGLPEQTYVDRFEQYDDKINVDGFALMHNDLFAWLVLVPGVRLQKNNPGLRTRTGDGLNIRVEYTYDYDGNRPRSKLGNGTILNGPNAGQRISDDATFTY